MDPAQILGVSRWLKPMKFAISIAIFTGTMAWILDYLHRNRKSVRWISAILAFAMTGEMILIAMQAARGVQSHFNWWYVTQDTASNTTGSATYKNKRTNLAYAFERQNAGVETTWQTRVATIGLRLEHESIDRDFREADTDEFIARISASFRPMRRVSIRGRYTYGQRDADDYDHFVTTTSYWYAPAEAADQSFFETKPHYKRSHVQILLAQAIIQIGTAARRHLCRHARRRRRRALTWARSGSDAHTPNCGRLEN